MRIIMKSSSVFLITFLIGTAIYFLIPYTERIIHNPQIVVEQPILPDVWESKLEQEVQPKAFNVENFWDDSQETFNRNLLETGEVSNVKDIKAKSGETWWGLFNKGSKQIFRPTQIKVNSYWKDGYWKEVSVKDKKNPLFLLKDKRKLKAGEVNTLLREKTWRENDDYDYSTEIKDGFSKKFIMNNIEYTLRAEKGVNTKQEKIVVLILETAKKSQIIHYIDYMGEGDYVGHIYWVGDLDRDGKLDLYMDFYGYEKGGYSSGLFLSSEAEKGNLVKKFEYFMFSGC